MGTFQMSFDTPSLLIVSPVNHEPHLHRPNQARVIDPEFGAGSIQGGSSSWWSGCRGASRSDEPMVALGLQPQNTAPAGFQLDTNLNTICSLVPGKMVSVALISSAILAAN